MFQRFLVALKIAFRIHNLQSDHVTQSASLEAVLSMVNYPSFLRILKKDQNDQKGCTLALVTVVTFRD